MKLGGPASYLAEVHSEQEVEETAKFAKDHNLPVITLGTGSNILFKDTGFSGLIIINKIPGLFIDRPSGIVQAGGGVNWNEVVSKSVDAGLYGIEALALIPGTAGATPVNNVGAYGQEIKDTLASLRAYDTSTNQFIELNNRDCDFSYRDSRFKTKEHGRFIICQITFTLKNNLAAYQPPDYPSLKIELNKLKINKPTPKDVETVISNMRRSKLPNPAWLANAGSFFKNPQVTQEVAKNLIETYPGLPAFDQPDGTKKLSAAWLIDKAGLKNHHQNGIWVYDQQALVLVNESATSFKDLQVMQDLIINTIKSKFGVILEPEPEII